MKKATKYYLVNFFLHAVYSALIMWGLFEFPDHSEFGLFIVFAPIIINIVCMVKLMKKKPAVSQCFICLGMAILGVPFGIMLLSLWGALFY
jgi:hypothetical protein